MRYLIKGGGDFIELILEFFFRVVLRVFVRSGHCRTDCESNEFSFLEYLFL